MHDTSPRIGRRSTRLAAASLAVAAMSLAACSAPGSTSPSTSGATSTGSGAGITAPVTAEEVAKLGDITLSVWADQGEQDLLGRVVPAYEKQFTNVKVDVQYKSFNDLTATVLNAMNSTNAPDVAQGNQGWATDGALVKAGLLRPLDDVADAYGWRAVAGAAISQLQWSDDGKTFGSGTLYGLAPDNQMVGIFYNKTKLTKLGIQPPQTFADLEAALKKAKDGGETPIELGNADKATAMQAFSVVQGAMTKPADTVAWITGSSGATFASDTNAAALQTWSDWVKAGYFSKGYDAMSPDDAAANFAKGQGVFLFAGNWQAGTVKDGNTFGFMAAPSGDTASHASSGSFGLNWHISNKSSKTPAAIAFVGMINDPKNAVELVAVNRVPIAADGVNSTDLMFSDLVKASKDQLGSSGSLYWYDWATDTMFDTFTAKLQELMAGRISPSDLTAAVQQDWDSFQAKRQ
ncbi:MAG: ABC transporter substrate-binding protein [Nostocoides sp.]